MNTNPDQISSFPVVGFISGLLIGGLAGTAIALLTAPQSGKKTRTMIRQKSVELRDQVADTADEARGQAEQVLRQARLQGRRATRRVGAKARELQQRGQAILEGQKAVVETTLEALLPAGRNNHS